MKLILNKKGFTLIELLIYVALLAGMTVMIAETFIILNKGKGGVQAKSELNSNLRFVTERIKRDVSASSVLVSPVNTAATSSILELTIEGDIVKYFLNNGQVVRQVGVLTPENISSDKVRITTLYFSRMENTNPVLDKTKVGVEINISGAYNSTSPDWQYSSSEKASADLKTDL